MPAKKKVTSKKVYKGVLKQEKKIAKKEVAKAKKKIHKKKKWTVAASVFGHHIGYNGDRGFFKGRGGISDYMRGPHRTRIPTERVQSGVNIAHQPTRGTVFFSPKKDRKQVGKDGLLVHGLQKWCTFGIDDTKTTANKQWLFIKDGLRTQKLEINPDAIGGSMAEDAQNYQYFKFKSLELIIVQPTVSVTAGGQSMDGVNFAMGHYVDGKIEQEITPDYDSLQSSNDMFEQQVINPVGKIIWRPKNLKLSQVKWFNTELDTTTDADDRMCCQGIIFGFYDVPLTQGGGSGTTYKVGDIYIRYIMELKGRISSNGITVSIVDRNLVADVQRLIYESVKKRKQDSKEVINENSVVRHYNMTMRHMSRYIGTTGSIPLGPPVVAIADVAFAGDPTKIATVSGNTLAVSTASTGNTSVDIKAINGTAVTGSDMPVNLKSVLGNSITSAAIPVVVSDATNTYYANVDAARKFPVNLAAASSTDVLPVNITQYNGNGMPNTVTNGRLLNNVMPIQIMGMPCATGTQVSSGTTVCVVESSSTASGTNANGGIGMTTVLMGKNETQMADIPSPTESLDSVMVMKMPKRKFKEVIEASGKDTKDTKEPKDKKPKGPPGPTEEDEDDMIPASVDIEECNRCDGRRCWCHARMKAKSEEKEFKIGYECPLGFADCNGTCSDYDYHSHPAAYCQHNLKDGVCIYCGFGKPEDK